MVEICDELDPELVRAGFLGAAPFKWVSLIIRYGTKTQLEPEFQRIDREDGELPIAIELPMEKLRGMGRDELKRAFTLATLDALICVGKKYGLPTEALQEKRTEVYHQVFRRHAMPSGVEAIQSGRCPRCGQELRTPKAKQCWKCGAEWHDGIPEPPA